MTLFCKDCYGEGDGDDDDGGDDDGDGDGDLHTSKVWANTSWGDCVFGNPNYAICKCWIGQSNVES